MNLSEKIVDLRKKEGISQEMLAEKLNVSRQAVSRWEQGAALPDALNILRLSKLFGVTADYLLNDNYESDYDIPRVVQVKEDNTRQILIALVTLEVMAVIIQFIMVIILKSRFFATLSFIMFASAIGGFEYAYIKNNSDSNHKTRQFRRKFYKISAWLGSYFPVRMTADIVFSLTSFVVSGIVREIVICIIYLCIVTIINLEIEKQHNNK